MYQLYVKMEPTSPLRLCVDYVTDVSVLSRLRPRRQNMSCVIVLLFYTLKIRSDFSRNVT